MFKKYLIVSTFIVIAGCTWVKPIDGAQAVKLAKPDYAVNCQSLGRTTSKVKDNLIGPLGRSIDKVKLELVTLAKNAAIELGGDTIVETIPVSNGKQTFAVYKCQ